MMERFDRRLVPQSLDQRDLKKRRLAPNSSPLLQDLQARYVKLSRRLRLVRSYAYSLSAGLLSSVQKRFPSPMPT